MKISKYELKKGLKQVVFRASNRQLVSVTNDNITDELVALAQEYGKGHNFVEVTLQKKSLNQLRNQLQPVLSTLNEVKIEEKSSLPVQPNKRVESLQPEAKAKRGRKPKSKE